MSAIVDRAVQIEAHGMWLRTFQWDWYFTLTFSNPVTEQGARHRLSRYAERLSCAAGDEVCMYWCTEAGPLGGRIHAHGLMSRVAGLIPSCDAKGRKCAAPCRCGTHLWQHGATMIAPYINSGGAAFYISKSIGRGQDWDIHGAPLRIAEPALNRVN